MPVRSVPLLLSSTTMIGIAATQLKLINSHRPCLILYYTRFQFSPNYIRCLMADDERRWDKVTAWFKTSYVESAGLSNMEGGKSYAAFLSELDPNYVGG